MLFCNTLKINEIVALHTRKPYTPKVVIKPFKYFMGSHGVIYMAKNKQILGGFFYSGSNGKVFYLNRQLKAAFVSKSRIYPF
jgi:hypothetical protein